MSCICQRSHGEKLCSWQSKFISREPKSLLGMNGSASKCRHWLHFIFLPLSCIFCFCTDVLSSAYKLFLGFYGRMINGATVLFSLKFWCILVKLHTFCIVFLTMTYKTQSCFLANSWSSSEAFCIETYGDINKHVCNAFWLAMFR